MSDCCKVPEKAAATDDRCQRCGEKGHRVLRETMESLLKSESLERLTDEPYYFDRTPECDVVYFSNEADSYFHKDDLTVRVGLKETESPISLCYCFGHTAESASEEIMTTGRSTVAERITAEVQAGNCSCEVENPSGKCCLGDVNRAIGEIQKELEPKELTGCGKTTLTLRERSEHGLGPRGSSLCVRPLGSPKEIRAKRGRDRGHERTTALMH